MNQKEFLKKAILMFESGQELDHDLIRYAMQMYITGLSVDDWSTDNYKQRIVELRKKITILFSDLNKDIDIATEESTSAIKILRDHIERSNDLPDFANVTDSDEVIKFAKGLTKNSYNFSEAQNLIGVTRQTLKKKVDKGVHGIKAEYKNKVARLSKENIIKLYRHFNPSKPYMVNGELVKKIKNKKIIDSMK